MSWRILWLGSVSVMMKTTLMSLDRAQQAEEIVSIASSAATMALEEARAEVAKLRTEKYLAEKTLEQERKVT